MQTETTAYKFGHSDGAEWDLSGFESPEAAAREPRGWDEATINAIGSAKFGELCGLTEEQEEARGAEWSAACREYTAGVRAAIAEQC